MIERQGDLVQISANSFESLAADHPLTFPVPFGSLPGNALFENTWHLIQFAFELPDPQTFPALGPMLSPDERRRLGRYVAKTYEMAESPFLRYPMRISFRFTSDSIEPTLTDIPPAENIRGFTALFRQFYSNEEPASFNKVQWAITQANERTLDGKSHERREQIQRWRRAVAKLRAYELRVVVGHQLRERGMYPHDGPFPGEMWSPDSLISTYNYGEELHWGSASEHLEMFENKAFFSQMMRSQFIESVRGIAHVFMGFGLLVESALGDAS